MPIMNTVIQGGGTTPTGTKNITANGTYDVTDFASADVQVPTTAPAHYVEKTVDANGVLINSTNIINLNGATNVFSYALCGQYYGVHFPSNTNVDLSTLTKITGTEACKNMFASCTGLTSVDLSGLTTISGPSACQYMVSYCNSLTSVDLSSLNTVSGQFACQGMFHGCTSLTNAALSSLTTISADYACTSMFASCHISTGVDLSSLTTISGNSACQYMFAGNEGLTGADLSSLSTISGSGACQNMFQGCTGLTNVVLSSLTEINGQSVCQEMFKGCTNLQTMDLSGLQTITGNYAVRNMFEGCMSLQTVKLSEALTKRNPTSILYDVPVQTCEYADSLEYVTIQVTGLCLGNRFATADMKKFELVNIQATYMFANNTNLTDIKFPVLTRWNGTGYAANMFSGCTNANFTDVYFPMLCVFRNAVPFTTTSFPAQLTVHFRKDQQTVIMGTTGASSNFGAAALIFDQIGTITVGGVDYVRQGKCNETGYYAWQKATSNITVNSVVYTFDVNELTRNIVPEPTGPILYGWKNGSTTIYTDSLKPQVGDYIWTGFNVEQSTTPIDAVDNEFIYTVDSAEPDVGDTAYSDATGTVLGTISAVA